MEIYNKRESGGRGKVSACYHQMAAKVVGVGVGVTVGVVACWWRVGGALVSGNLLG